MVDEQWYIIADFKILRVCWKFSKLGGVKKYVEYFDGYQNLFFSIKLLLLKGIQIYSFNISEILWDVKIENGVLIQIQKNTRHKMGTHFKTQF